MTGQNDVHANAHAYHAYSTPVYARPAPIALDGGRAAHSHSHPQVHSHHAAVGHGLGRGLEHKYAVKAPSKAAPAESFGPAKTADEVVKILAVVAIILMLMGRISLMDTIILLGLGFVWFTRTTTLGGGKKK